MRKNLCCYGYIFAITNSINGKIYIGQSLSGINQSVKRILRNIKNPSTSEFKSPLRQDISKYGQKQNLVNNQQIIRSAGFAFIF